MFAFLKNGLSQTGWENSDNQALNEDTMRLASRVLRSARRATLPEGYFATAAWDILCELDDSRAEGETLGMPDLASRLGLAPAYLARYTQRLSRDGFLTYEPWSDDADRAPIKITSEGLGLLERVFRFASQSQTENGLLPA